jgi:alpha-glucosidase
MNLPHIKLLSALLLVGTTWEVAAESSPATVVSPDGQLAVHFSLKNAEGIENGLFWRIDWRGRTIMEASRLGFELQGAPPLAGGFELVKIERANRDERWKPVYGEAAEYRDHYREMRVTVRDQQTPPRVLVLNFRAYNEGAAYRATFPQQEAFDTLTITAERTQFRFPGDHQAWVTRHAQGIYETRALSKLDSRHEYERPLVMKTAGGKYVAICEAGNLDYARMRLSRDPSAPHAVISRLGSSCVIRPPCHTPWRLVMPANNPCELLEHNYLLLNLSPPCRLKDTAWIRPGKQMRDVTITKAGSMGIIDLADKLGLDYLEIDAGWYGDERDDQADATTVTPARSRGGFTEQDLHEVIAHAKARGLGVILYVNRRHLERQLDELLPLYRKWGVAGLKFGFIQEGPQRWTQWLHDSLARCAEYHMVVDAHDEYRPTGTERTYPNFLTAEGVRGNETRPIPKQDVENAFLRGLCGPADFTMCWHAPGLKLSWAHQMAASVVYYSPLQALYWYDQPGQFTGKEPYLEFFRALPTVWDEKRVLQGEIGEYITIARRKGDAWFVGTMNAVKHRRVDIPLKFLLPGRKYKATIYADDPSVLEVKIDPHAKGRANPESKKLKMTTREVTAETVIHADLANNGGQAIHIVPIRQNPATTDKDTAAASVSPVPPPNIVFILADDMGYGDVSILNHRDQKILTPHIDRIGREGMIFTDAHSGSAVCTPTRYGVLTGRYAWRTRLKSGVLNGYNHHLIETGRLTVASLLKQHGYHTAAFGKWHLGMDFPVRPGATQQAPDKTTGIDWRGTIRHSPIANGFDEFFGIAASLDMPPYIFIHNDHFVGGCTAISPRKSHCRPGPIAPNFKFEEVLPTITQKTTEFIGKQKAGTPFFVYVALTAPHTPIVPTKQFSGKNSLGPYGDFCEEVDWCVGQVLEALDQRGLTKNTLVIFTSDNGCAPYIGVKELEKKGHYPSYIYRGYKADIFEGGHRIPFLARWPAKIKAGSVSDEVICLTDLLATSAVLVGAALPDNAGEDSCNILPALLGEKRDRPIREATVHHSIGGYFAIRRGKWKLELCRGSGGWGYPREQEAAKLGLPPVQLYDMSVDVRERRNVASAHPEVVKQLKALLARYIREGRSTSGRPQPYVNPPRWRQIDWIRQ